MALSLSTFDLTVSIPPFNSMIFGSCCGLNSCGSSLGGCFGSDCIFPGRLVYDPSFMTNASIVVSVEKKIEFLVDNLTIGVQLADVIV